jgi:hypothetical protein
VLATQDPSDLEAVDRALLPQVLQDTASQLVFRQGSPQDAERIQALSGQALAREESWRSDGVTSTRMRERPRVRIDEWMNALEPGDAWLRVAPIDKGWRQERVRVALPRPAQPSPEHGIVRRAPRIQSSDTKAATARRVYPSGVSEVPPRVAALAAVPPDCPEDLVAKMGADVLSQVERRWPKRHHELGPCLVWTGQQYQDRPYGRLYDPRLKRTDYAHRVVWRRGCTA